MIRFILKLKSYLKSKYNYYMQFFPYKRLDGTMYSRYYLPLDYAPSRNLNPRWGGGTEPIKQLDEWFRKFDFEYLEITKLMYLNILNSKIPLFEREISSSKSKVSWIGGPFSPFDKLALYSIISKFKPKTFLEIGSGVSTLVAFESKNEFKLKMKIVSIDPQPRQEIDFICDDIHRTSLEEMDLDVFKNLEKGDILFFDGSHRSFMNSDVTVFFIDVLPLIKPGVIIHLHDIHLPYDYPAFFKNWYWNEQYMLAVYLMGHAATLKPILPTAWVTRDSKFSENIKYPFVPGKPESSTWLGDGGSFWFTKS